MKRSEKKDSKKKPTSKKEGKGTHAAGKSVGVPDASVCAVTEGVPLRIEVRLIDELVPYERNARKHSDEQIDQIVGSIQEFGWTNPILIDEAQNVIAGHGRLEAAKRLGLPLVPVICIHHLTDAQKRGLSIADNKLALNSSWDQELLQFEIKEIATSQEVEMSVLGFSESELRTLFDRAPLPHDEAFLLCVRCTSAHQQTVLMERLTSEGFVCDKG